MGTIRTTSGVLGIALLAAVMSGAGSQVAAGAAIDPEVLVAREATWRAFYDGDVKTLGDQLPEDFIGTNMNDSPSRIEPRCLMPRERFVSEAVDW